MSLLSVSGIDHAVILVRDLDAGRDRFARLGFTISPRGKHSAQMGTANHTIMLQDDYVELVGILQPTEANARRRAALKRREGLNEIALAPTGPSAQLSSSDGSAFKKRYRYASRGRSRAGARRHSRSPAFRTKRARSSGFSPAST
jgi:hypothetical protein